MQIEDLLSGSASSHMLGTKSSSLDSSLQLGIPINRSHVGKMEDAGNGLSTDHIMKQIGINSGGGNNRVAAGGRTVLWDAFTGTCMTGVEPIIPFLWSVRVVGFVSSNANDTVFELRKIPNNMIDMVKVSLTRTCAKARKRHDRGSNVESTNLDGPLERSNEGLVDLNVWIVKQFGGVKLRVIALYNRRVCIMGTFTKESKVIIHDLLNVLMRGVAEITIVITEPITSKVKGNHTSTLELEFMLIREGFDDGRRVLTGNQ